MRSLSAVVLVAFATLSALCLASVMCDSASPATKNLLVVSDDPAISGTHSRLFDHLGRSGYTLTFAGASDDSLSLESFGEANYNAVLLLIRSSAELANALSRQGLLDMINQGLGNVIVAVQDAVPDDLREFAAECGVEFAEDHTFVQDHHSHHSSDSDGAHTLLVASATSDAGARQRFFGDAAVEKIAFRGLGLELDQENPLLTPLLVGSSTAYTSSSASSLSPSVVLAASMQSRGNARVVFVGSVELFGDEMWGLDGVTNAAFVKSLTSWTYKSHSVLRVSAVSHAKLDPETREVIDREPQEYTVRNWVRYELTVEEFSDGKWHGFQGDDMQLEFTMLDPLVRDSLRCDENGVCAIDFEAPDVYGVFKFDVVYNRPGYTWLRSTRNIRVRPYRLDEFERFIPAAYPYYAGALAVMAGWFVFSLLFLFGHNRPAVKLD